MKGCTGCQRRVLMQEAKPKNQNSKSPLTFEVERGITETKCLWRGRLYFASYSTLFSISLIFVPYFEK
jgi:hypothetical protein